MRAAVIGLGKIGLPLAVQIAGRGIPVMGSDIDPHVVESVNRGVPHFPGEPDLDWRLAQVVESGALEATGSTKRAVEESDIVIVVVPLIVDAAGDPDFGSIDGATAEIGDALRVGQIVIYETTLPVGTTRNRFGKILEQRSGLEMGVDFHLAFSPERVSSGSVFRDLGRYPKLVGGVDDRSTAAAIAFYERVLEFQAREDLVLRSNGVWDMGSAEAAEFVKLAETTYRDVNIALANEFAENAERLGLDVDRVIAAANSQPYSHIHSPGVAVGGHCIPVYPRFYLAGHKDAQIPAVARDVNRGQPDRAVERLAGLLGSLAGMRVALLGAAYRGGVKETAFSGVFALSDAVQRLDGEVLVHDPLFTDDEIRQLGFEPYHLGSDVDAAIIQANHAEYATLGPEDLPGCKAVVDGRRVLDLSRWSESQAEILVVGVG